MRSISGGDCTNSIQPSSSPSPKCIPEGGQQIPGILCCEGSSYDTNNICRKDPYCSYGVEYRCIASGTICEPTVSGGMCKSELSSTPTPSPVTSNVCVPEGGQQIPGILCCEGSGYNTNNICTKNFCSFYMQNVYCPYIAGRSCLPTANGGECPYPSPIPKISPSPTPACTKQGQITADYSSCCSGTTAQDIGSEQYICVITTTVPSPVACTPDDGWCGREKHASCCAGSICNGYTCVKSSQSSPIPSPSGSAGSCVVACIPSYSCAKGTETTDYCSNLNTRLNCCGDSKLECFNNRTIVNGLVYYNQRDPCWKNYPLPAVGECSDNNNLGVNICGQTAVSSLLATYIDSNINPLTETYKDFSDSTNCGETQNKLVEVLEGYGFIKLNITGYDNEIRNAMKDPNIKGLVSLNYTNARGEHLGGHHIILARVDENGTRYYNDPYYGSNLTLEEINIKAHDALGNNQINVTIEQVTLVRAPDVNL